MAERVARNLDFASKLQLSVAGLLILAATACLAAAFTPEAFGQGSPSPATPAFEVADVHASPYVRFPFMDGGDFTSDRYILHQATMTEIVAAAYHLDPANVQGGPSWLDWAHFDIVAKAPPTTSKATIRLMLQSLLAQRFSLVVHTGTAPMPAYVLSAPNGKTKLKKSEGTGDPDCEDQPPPANQAAGAIPQILFTCHNETMEKFAEDVHNWANGYLTKPVVDSTGLNGAYDFDLKWTPRGLLDRAGPDGISIFDAVDKELGLKLTLQTAPQPGLIVDSVNESPTPNPPDLAKRMPPLPPPQIEVATIKPSKPDETRMFRIKGDQMNGQGISLKEYIQFAWDLNGNDDESLAGAPKWLGEDRIDIVAKLETDDTGGATPKAPQVLQQELQQMLHALIEDRFQMKDHWENRPVTAYNLVAVNPKLATADPKSRTRCDEGPGPDGKDPRIANPVLNRLLTCQNLTMAQFGVLLQSLASGFIFSPVLDDTGLKSSYNFTLSFSSADHFAPGGSGGAPSPDGAPQPSDPNGAISLFDAVKNQLGLKLEKEKRPVPVLVIDHIDEQPTAN
jgi:uncharacterized protein (TIGR03435 family)